jgi:hypothetical protein
MCKKLRSLLKRDQSHTELDVTITVRLLRVAKFSDTVIPQPQNKRQATLNNGANNSSAIYRPRTL